MPPRASTCAMSPESSLHFVGERLDVVAAAQRVDHVGEVRLFAQDVLRVDGDARTELGRAGQRLVVCIGVQRLQPAENAGHGLHRDARDVVERLLPREIDARCLAVELEAPGARVCAEALARDARPDAPAGAELGDLLEQADRNVEEKGEARQEGVHVRPPRAVLLAYWMAEDRVKAMASAGVAPACCMCCPTTDIGFQLGTCRLQNSMWSVRMRARQRDAEEHVVGDEVAQIVALVGGAADRAPVDAAPFCGREHECEQGKRRRIVHGAGSAGQIHAGEALSMCSTVFTTTPQVPSNSACTSSMS